MSENIPNPKERLNRTLKLALALTTICQKASFKVNADQLDDFESIEPEDLAACINYLQSFPEAGAQQAWEFLHSQAVGDHPAFDHHLDNQHPCVQFFCQALVHAVRIDPMWLIDLDEYLPAPQEPQAPETLDGPTALDPQHPVIVALQKLYAHSHQLPENVVAALSQLATAVEQDSAVLESFVATTTKEVEAAQADGGFSQAEAQVILDNKIEDEQPEAVVKEDLTTEIPEAPQEEFVTTGFHQTEEAAQAPEEAPQPEQEPAAPKKSSRPKATN